MEILKLLSDKFTNIRFEDITNHGAEKIKKIRIHFKNAKNIIMYCKRKDDTEEYLKINFLLNDWFNREMQENDSDEFFNYNIDIKSKKMFIFSEKIIEPVDNSNNNEFNNDYYKDMILNRNPKKKKFTTEIITTSLDLNKDLDEDYLNYCKNTQLNINKINKIKHITIRELNNPNFKYKPLDSNYTGALFYSGNFYFIYEDMNMDEFFKDIEDWINNKFAYKLINKYI